VVVGAATVGELALDPITRDQALTTLAKLEPDDYADYVRDFVGVGTARADDRWRYADILTALSAAATLLQPESYLEIGVRRGRSMAIVAGIRRDCSMIGVDLWLEGYAGMTNPGPAFVRGELAKVGHTGSVELITGSSHQVLPDLFTRHPELSFDLVTVDGDHSPRGAERDLRDVLPRLRIGGAVVFDDIRHPQHPALNRVWLDVVASDRRFSCWEFDDVGYGVAVGVRRW
jgi:predicted O-methyltransferase YrrM